ncbi:hypothetical protein D8O27_21570 [Burkholderia mallei]|nr:hypothetical protein DM57_15930 [Burkholderia mallei]EDK60459.1 hypothetical protein BMAJHU_C0528 [Burkholderia mallei JHU]EDK85799.1 hypothetical protein BMA721280_A0340 [Burkholderia mallei 2002721280]EDP88985.1 hypothetical protein BMA10399_E1033 [Burkholderia mallei ATCC 10399]EES47320.1 hypothetical protein BMAPRL20_A1417 [Burkholderia mallei PRL-20]
MRAAAAVTAGASPHRAAGLGGRRATPARARRPPTPRRPPCRPPDAPRQRAAHAGAMPIDCTRWRRSSGSSNSGGRTPLPARNADVFACSHR